MKSNLGIICSYHDLSTINITNINIYLGFTSDKIYLLDNRQCRSEELQVLYDKYKMYPGINFDEFNALSYYCNMTNPDPEIEFVYNCHYRRCLSLPRPCVLHPETIFCSLSDKSQTINLFFKKWFFTTDKDNYLEGMKHVKFVFSEIFGLEYDEVDNLMKFNIMYGHQLFLCHIDVLKELVTLGYEFIEKICDRFSGALDSNLEINPDVNIDSQTKKIELLGKKYFNTSDFMGTLLEGFVSFFITLKRKNGFTITITDTKMI